MSCELYGIRSYHCTHIGPRWASSGQSVYNLVLLYAYFCLFVFSLHTWSNIMLVQILHYRLHLLNRLHACCLKSVYKATSRIFINSYIHTCIFIASDIRHSNVTYLLLYNCFKKAVYCYVMLCYDMLCYTS